MSPTRVFGWAADWSGCGYFRVGLPLDRLGQLDGFETAASPTLAPPWCAPDPTPAEALDSIDVLVGQRVCNEGATRIWQDACARPDVRTVFEIDDDLFHVDPSNAKPYALFSQPEVRARLAANIAAADAVTCTTDPLANQLRALNPNVHVVPNYIPADWLTLPLVEPADHVRIGWAGSGPHHVMDFRAAGPQISRYARRNPGVELVTIGGDMFRQFGAPSTVVPGAPEVADYHAKHEFDIGLAPLARHLFNDAKSSLKALHYAARGIPVLASDEPPYRGFVQHGTTGFLIRRDHEWGHYLHCLVQDPPRLREMGRRAYQVARQHTIEQHIGMWATVLAPALVAA